MVSQPPLTLYFLAGLGFDGRIFRKLELPEGPKVYLDWLDPLKGESIQEYAIRMSRQVEGEPGKAVFIGQSFGGVVMQEMARQVAPAKTLIISSIKSRAENTASFKLLGLLPLHYLISKKLMLKSFPLWAANNGYETEDEQQLFLDMVGRHSPRYLRWATRELGKWQGASLENVAHIHGTRDKTFPARRVSGATLVEGGNHFMVYNRPREVSEFIRSELTELF